jgi:hypothetical protein
VLVDPSSTTTNPSTEGQWARAPRIVSQIQLWLKEISGQSRTNDCIFIRINNQQGKICRKRLPETAAMGRAVLKPFMKIGIRRRTTFVDVLYGEKIGDPKPFTLTVSPRFVSRKTSQSLPLTTKQIQDYAARHADTILRDIALSRREAGDTAYILWG